MADDFTLAAQVLVTAAEVQAAAPAPDDVALEGVRVLAQGHLNSMLLRSGVDVDYLDAATAAKVASRLAPIALHVWLSEYYRYQATNLGDGGFSYQMEEHLKRVGMLKRELLTEPLSVLGVEDDRARGNLRFVAGTI